MTLDWADRLPEGEIADITDTGRYERLGSQYGAESLNGAAAEPLPQAVRACDVEAAEPVDWLEYGQIPKNELALIVGDGGAGKTTYDLRLAAAKAAEGLTVLFVSEEDPEEVLVNRLEAIAMGHR